MASKSPVHLLSFIFILNVSISIALLSPTQTEVPFEAAFQGKFFDYLNYIIFF